MKGKENDIENSPIENTLSSSIVHSIENPLHIFYIGCIPHFRILFIVQRTLHIRFAGHQNMKKKKKRKQNRGSFLHKHTHTQIGHYIKDRKNWNSHSWFDGLPCDSEKFWTINMYKIGNAKLQQMECYRTRNVKERNDPKNGIYGTEY